MVVQCDKIFCNAQGSFFCTDLTFLSFFFNIAAGGELCAAGIKHGHREATGIRLQALDQGMLESEHGQIFQLTVIDDVSLQTGLYEE